MRPVSMRGMTRHDVPFEASARPSAAALARCARGADMMTRGGGCVLGRQSKSATGRLSFADPSSGGRRRVGAERAGLERPG